MAFKLANLFVEIGADKGPLDRTLGAVHRQLSGLSVAVGTMAGTLGAQLVNALGGAAVAGFDKVILGASNLNETLNRTNTIFGPAAATVIAESERMAEQFGVAKEEYLSAASSFGAAFKGAGKSQEEAAALGNQLAQLGMDLASFGNASNAEVFTALQASLRGEFDPLERFNVFLTAADVKAKALAMGLGDASGEIDNNAKKTATLALIMEKTGDAQGDLAKTIEDPANAMRRLGGMFANTAAEIGTLLIPAFKTFLGVGNEVFAGIRDWLQSNQATISGWAAGLSTAFDFVGVLWRNLGLYAQLGGLAVMQAASNIGEWIAWLPGAAGKTLVWFASNFPSIMTDTFNAVWAIVENVGKNITAFWRAVWDFVLDPKKGFQFDATPLLDGFKATLSELPNVARPVLTDLSKQMDEVGASIATNEAKRLAEKAKAAGAAVAASGPATAQDAAEAAAGGGNKPKKEKERKVETSSIADFARKLQEGTFGKDKTASEQLAVQKQQLAVQQEQLGEARKATRKAAATVAV